MAKPSITEGESLSWSMFSSLSRAIRRRLSSSSRTCRPSEATHQIDDHIPPEPSPLPSGSAEQDNGRIHAVRQNAVELMHFHTAAVSLLQNGNIYVNFSAPGAVTMANERREMSKHGWYWGTITVNAAQRKLNGKPNGSFLVRDSQTGPFQFSISFRSAGYTLHTRVDFLAGYWTFFADRRYRTMVDLIEDTMREEGILCSVPSSAKSLGGADNLVQIRLPVSRFVESSLQHLCRTAILAHLHKGGESVVQQLPLPKPLIDYLTETTFDAL